MNPFVRTFVGAIPLLLIAGCASHDVKPLRVPTASDMPSQSQGENVVVYADAYASEKRQEAVFDEVLTEEGVLPVEVLVVNRSGETISGRPSDARFVLPDERNFAPVGAAAVADEFYSSGNIIGSALAFGLVGALISSGAENTAAESRRVDFQNKMLKDVRLGPGEERHGFLYFALPENANRHRVATLRLNLQRGANAPPLVADVALNIAGLNLEGTLEQPAYVALDSGASLARTGSAGRTTTTLTNPSARASVSPVDPIAPTAGSSGRSCTDAAFADLPVCREWLEAWNEAHGAGRLPPSPTAPLRTAAVTLAPPPPSGTGTTAAPEIPVAAYGVTLARYHDREVAATSWDQYVARFPLLGAAVSRVVPATAADGGATYLLQGGGLTERQAAAICDEMRRADAYCEIHSPRVMPLDRKKHISYAPLPEGTRVTAASEPGRQPRGGESDVYCRPAFYGFGHCGSDPNR